MKGANPDENLDMFKQLLLFLRVKGLNINKNSFTPQSELHTTNLCFLLFCSIYGEIHRELSFLDIKVTISERNNDIPRKFVLLNMFEKDQILR